MRVRWLIAFGGVAWALTVLPGRAAAAQCTADPVLSDAAAALLLDASRPARPSADSLARAARKAGSDLPWVHALLVHQGEQARVDAWLARLAAHADAPLVCGEARRDDERLLIAGARGGVLVVDPAHPARLRFHLAAGFARPRIAVRDAHGAVAWLTPEAHRSAVEVPPEAARPVLVQLVADGPAGPRPVAQRVVGDGRTDDGGTATATRIGPETRPAPGIGIVGTPPPSASIAARVDGLRAQHRALPLRPNRLMSLEATDHAQRVCRAGRVAHALEPGADPEARLARRGLRARVVGEVVARAATVRAAFAALARSPSHLATLVDRRFTDVGVGRGVDDEGRTCLVVLLTAWPRIVPR